MYFSKCSECVCLFHVFVDVVRGQRRAGECPGAGVRAGCELPDVALSLLQGQQVLLTSEPPLQPHLELSQLSH